MTSQTVIKKGTIVCQECGEEIDAVETKEGVKTWYGICQDCKDKKEQK